MSIYQHYAVRTWSVASQNCEERNSGYAPWSRENDCGNCGTGGVGQELGRRDENCGDEKISSDKNCVEKNCGDEPRSFENDCGRGEGGKLKMEIVNEDEDENDLPEMNIEGQRL